MSAAIRGAAVRDMVDNEAAEAGKKSRFRGIWYYKRGRSVDVGPWSKPSWSAVLQDPPAGAGPPPRRLRNNFTGRNDPPFFELHGLKSELEAAAAADFVSLWMRLRCKVRALQSCEWNLPALRLWEQPVTLRTLRGHKLADVAKTRIYIRRKVAELKEGGQLKNTRKRAAEPAQGEPAPSKKQRTASAAPAAPPRKGAAAGSQRTKASAAGQQTAAPKRRAVASQAQRATPKQQRQCSTLLPPRWLMKVHAQQAKKMQAKRKQQEQQMRQQQRLSVPTKRQRVEEQRRQEKEELDAGLRRMAEAQARRSAAARQERQREEAAAVAARKRQAEQKRQAKQELGRERAKRRARRAIGK